MKSRGKKKIQELKNSRLYKFSHKWSLFFLLLTVAFTVMMVATGLIIFKYILIACIGIILITAMLFPAMYSWRFKKSRRLICLALSFVISIVYCIGIFYFAGTMDFFSKVTNGDDVEEYYVIVRDDGTYEKIGDIKGNNVYACNSGDGFDDAVMKLESKVDAKVVVKSNLENIASDLLRGKKDVMLIYSANYSAVCDKHDNFDDDTKILETIEVKNKGENIAKRVNVRKDAFNIYITGIDTDGDIKTTSRSDVNMIMTVNPRTKKVLLTSIPRDYYVAVSGADGESDKLTHTGLFGAKTTVETAANLMGLDMNYYVKVNYATVKELIDAIGGITVHSDYAFSTHGMNVHMEFVKGENYLDGDAALAFARERYSFPDGDFQRNKNQQIVLEAALTKVASSSTILTKYTSILNAVEDYVEMNFLPKEIKTLVKMQMRDMSGWNVQMQSVTGNVSENFMPCYALNGGKASVVIPDEDSIDAAKEKIKKVMEER